MYTLGGYAYSRALGWKIKRKRGEKKERKTKERERKINARRCVAEEERKRKKKKGKESRPVGPFILVPAPDNEIKGAHEKRKYRPGATQRGRVMY